MKDLYTFDSSVEAALSTYEQVQRAYSRFFSALKLPFLVAEASSGTMGGKLSHEYHLPNSIGEDLVVTCNECNYVANDEVAESRLPLTAALYHSTANGGPRSPYQAGHPLACRVWRGISSDRKMLVNVWLPPTGAVPSPGQANLNVPNRDVNIHAIKDILPSLDASIEDPLSAWASVLSNSSISGNTDHGQVELLNIVDSRLPVNIARELSSPTGQLPVLPAGSSEVTRIPQSLVIRSKADRPLNLLPIQAGDRCPRCDTGKLAVHRALELGHTFHLGMRYSEPLNATITIPSPRVPGSEAGPETVAQGRKVAVQMGCHGVGISRIIGAMAEHLSDDRGLNWPRVIAPYEIVVIPQRGLMDDAFDVYDAIAKGNCSPGDPQFDVVLDDRGQSFVWKLKDADLVGYPVVVILGKAWLQDKYCEVQCRRMSLREVVHLEKLPTYLAGLLERL
jgi:prolyl-tRNA synthetase